MLETLEGALGSFGDGQWLTTTAIGATTRMLHQQAITMYDASFMRVNDPQAMLKKPSRGSLFLRSWPVERTKKRAASRTLLE